jgi:MFS family permease
MSAPNHQHHPAIKLPLSLSIIFGSFTLGFYVAIQGPTLMDLIDLLHVNNDIMSHSLAFASLAYSVGGLLSGFLFNYVDRQILIPGYYVVFGVSNILTPYITNYYVFSVVTVFKMMCAGGTDCGANVWILDMWPGKDAWLQALHFSFAVGCALGPLVVEPFLSASEHSGSADASLHWDGKGSALINNENTESRIYIPYGVSGSASLLAAALIVYLYYLEERKRREERVAAVQTVPLAPVAAAAGTATTVATPNAIQAPPAVSSVAVAIPMGPAQAATKINMADEAPASEDLNNTAPATPTPPPSRTTSTPANNTNTTTNPPQANNNNNNSNSPTALGGAGAGKQSAIQLLAIERPPTSNSFTSPTSETTTITFSNATTKSTSDKLDIISSSSSNLQIANSSNNNNSSQLVTAASATANAHSTNPNSVKFTSKAKEQMAGRPPYYVMFAIALAALCLSFYCGIEITSMNYLATFAVNIDLQLPKSTAALMSSALTISFAVGRLFGIWIAAYMRPHKLFYLCSAVMALGNVFILIFANTAERFLWASICLFGIGCGPMYASIVSFYDDRIAKVTNTVSGIFILGSMFNVALNTLIIGHYIIDNALILIVCNLIGAVLLLCLFGSLHALTRIKKNQRKRKFKLQQLRLLDTMKLQQQAALEAVELKEAAEQQVALLDGANPTDAQDRQQQQLECAQPQPQPQQQSQQPQPPQLSHGGPRVLPVGQQIDTCSSH